MAGMDIFQLRIEYCEEKLNNCIAEIQTKEEFEEIYSAKFLPCKSILNDCLKSHFTN